AGLLTNLGSVSFNSSDQVLTHHTGDAGTPGGVDTPYSDADLAAGPFAGQLVVSAYHVGDMLSGLTSFDPNKLDPRDGLNKFLDTLQAILNGPVLGPKLPLLGDKIKGAIQFVDQLRTAVGQIRPGDAASINLALEGALGPALADITNDSDADHVQFNV